RQARRKGTRPPAPAGPGLAAGRPGGAGPPARQGGEPAPYRGRGRPCFQVLAGDRSDTTDGFGQPRRGQRYLDALADGPGPGGRARGGGARQPARGRTATLPQALAPRTPPPPPPPAPPP